MTWGHCNTFFKINPAVTMLPLDSSAYFLSWLFKSLASFLLVWLCWKVSFSWSVGFYFQSENVTFILSEYLMMKIYCMLDLPDAKILYSSTTLLVRYFIRAFVPAFACNMIKATWLGQNVLSRIKWLLVGDGIWVGTDSSMLIGVDLWLETANSSSSCNKLNWIF